MDRREKLSKQLALCGAGFLAFLGQGAAFREFLGVFEGDELSLGFLLAFWLLWICAGSFAALKSPRLASFCSRHFRTALLCYIPALALQLYLCSSARSLAGVGDYEIFPFAKLLLASFLATAPLSLLTGFLFVAGALWLSGEGVPAAKAYALESLGSCAGALASTLLLLLGLGNTQLFLCGSALLSCFALASNLLVKRLGLLPASLLVIALATLFSGAGSLLDAKLDALAFQQLAPDGLFKRAFNTSQARYLLGQRGEQFLVVSQGAASECLPSRENASQRVLELLPQAPEARRIFVAGTDSLSLCLRLAELSGVKEIVYSSPDPGFLKSLRVCLPPEIPWTLLDKIKFSNLDPKDSLDSMGSFDLIVINPVNYASLSSNRFTNNDFMQSVKKALSSDGVTAFLFPGSDGHLGETTAKLGASLYANVKRNFAFTLLKPGAESCFFAAKRDGLLCSVPEELIAKAYRISGVPDACEPEVLLDVYSQERARFQEELYEKEAKRGGSPFQAALASAAKKTGFPSWLWAFLQRLGPLLPALVFGYALLRFLWLCGSSKNAAAQAASPFDAKTALFLSAFAGGSFFVLLLTRQQTAYGSLATHFGLLSALFMGGLALGGHCAERGVGANGRDSLRLGFLLAFLALAALSCNSLLPPFLIWGQAFATGSLCGFIAGRCVCEVKRRAFDDARSSFLLEFGDCLGGALGGFLCSLAILPSGSEFLAWPLLGLSLPLAAACLEFSRRRGGEAFSLGFALFLLPLFIALGAFSFKDFLESGSWRLMLGFAALLAALVAAKALKNRGFEGEGDAMLKAKEFPTKSVGLYALYAICLLGGALLLFSGRGLSTPGQSGAPFPQTPPLKELKLSLAAPESDAEDDPRGKPRKISEARFKELIKAGRLSSKEASYWLEAPAR